MPSPSPSIAVIICSYKRPEVLHDTVISLRGQTQAPREVIVCVSDEPSALPATRTLAGIRIILGPPGLTASRNHAIAQLTPGSDLVLFLDDDVELAPNFLAVLSERFARHADVVLAGGVDIAWGLPLGSITREGARRLLDDAALNNAAGADKPPQTLSGPAGMRLTAVKRLALSPQQAVLALVPDIKGCSMCVRRALLDQVRFDERLALYGYLEDLDFCAQCRRFGTIVVDTAALLVHLEVVGGRFSEVKRGFSEVINPIYLWSKGNASFFRTVLLAHLILRPLRNLGRSIVDPLSRRRLRGNLLAFSRLFRGTVDPEYILRVPN